jgi:hypothetical protein
LGIDDVLHFDFLSAPPAEIMMRALEMLFACGAIDAYCKLTKPIGAFVCSVSSFCLLCVRHCWCLLADGCSLLRVIV